MRLALGDGWQRSLAGAEERMKMDPSSKIWEGCTRVCLLWTKVGSLEDPFFVCGKVPKMPLILTISLDRVAEGTI